MRRLSRPLGMPAARAARSPRRLAAAQIISIFNGAGEKPHARLPAEPAPAAETQPAAASG